MAACVFVVEVRGRYPHTAREENAMTATYFREHVAMLAASLAEVSDPWVTRMRNGRTPELIYRPTVHAASR